MDHVRSCDMPGIVSRRTMASTIKTTWMSQAPVREQRERESESAESIPSPIRNQTTLAGSRTPQARDCHVSETHLSSSPTLR